MRKRSGTPPEVHPTQPVTIIKQVRKYQVITPLYGGGVNPAEPDPITVVRATEIRGHLRFWWRACRGGQYGSSKAIKEAEDELWGAAGTKEGGGSSQVQVEVADYSVINKAAPSIAPSYAVFPLRQTPNKRLYVGVSFTLNIYFPVTKQQEVEAALKMWEIFGGIGARTRRGFGALRLVSVDGVSNSDLPGSTKEEAKTWVQGQLKQYVVLGTHPNGMPHLTHATVFKITDSSKNVMDVWDDLIEQLRDFRQQRQGDDPEHPGRSIWPEPSEIRRFTDQSLPGHDKPPIPDPPICKFPRAVFGLPIIFQFKDRDRYNPDNKEKDPRNTVLRLDTSERLASPLILKPLACQNGKYVGLAVILDGTKVDEDRLLLKTQDGAKKEDHVKYIFDSTESLEVGEDSSGNPITIDSNTNALQAFLKYLEGI